MPGAGCDLPTPGFSHLTPEEKVDNNNQKRKKQKSKDEK